MAVHPPMPGMERYVSLPGVRTLQAGACGAGGGQSPHSVRREEKKAQHAHRHLTPPTPHHTHNPLVQAGRTVVRVDKVGFEVGENDKTIHRGTQQRGLAREGQRPQGHGPGHEGGWESGCVDVCPCGEGGKEKRACAPR